MSRKRPAEPIECPYDAATEVEYVETTKAYRNREFMNSREARHIRILCEFEETRKRLRENEIAGTIVFLGSRRALGTRSHAARVAELQAELDQEQDEEVVTALKATLDRLGRLSRFCGLVDSAELLAQKLTEWAVSIEGAQQALAGEADRPETGPNAEAASPGEPKPAFQVAQRLVVCTGGGPGFMEAANRGASKVPGAKSMGMSTYPPTAKDTVSSFVTPALAFTFHYGFSNKFWMTYPAKAVVVCPGGFSTCDELFEVLTLKQTGKIHPSLPIVLLGTEYWANAFDFRTMVDFGVISEPDIKAFLITDDVQVAFDYVTSAISRAPKTA